eukprot:scaffold15956_cov32-Cyclotella_meneghiniana.AAC.5
MCYVNGAIHGCGILSSEDDWLETAIQEGTCIAVTDGSCIREIFDDVCSCGQVGRVHTQGRAARADGDSSNSGGGEQSKSPTERYGQNILRLLGSAKQSHYIANQPYSKRLNLSFDCEYFHVEAHQDEHKAYLQLERPTQLNCCMDIKAKNVL